MIYIAVISLLSLVLFVCRWSGISQTLSECFFESVDKRLSTHWMKNNEVGRGGMIHTSIVIKEWAEDRSFYERLIDGDQDVMDVFNVHRQTMDDE